MATKIRTIEQAEIEANEIVEKWVALNGATGWIPFSALWQVGTDGTMIRQVADAFGVEFFNMDAVKAHLGGLVGGVVAGSAVAEVTGWIPLVGWIGKSIGMAAKTALIGEAVIEYFRELSPLASGIQLLTPATNKGALSS